MKNPSTQSSTPVDPEKTDETPINEPPYHILTPRQKKQLVYIVSLAGLFSPLSSNIYFPALDTIARDLHVSVSLIALTVTSYMILQGIAPSFWSAFADSLGRRPIYISTFIVYIIANIGLAITPNFPVLMTFRAIQAAGSSATISVGAGVIADIATPAERGGFVGIYGGIRMLGQSVGPVLGGILAQFLGFRSIFDFLLIFSTLVLAFIIFFLPETHRAIAGNGTIRLRGVYRPVFQKFREEPDYLVEQDPDFKLPKISLFTIVEPLKFLFEKDVFATLLFGSVVYTVWSMVTSSTTSLFVEHYRLSQILVGCAFLPNGAGCVLGSYITGRIMDKDYKIIEQHYIKEKNLEAGTNIDRKNRADDFPIERTRMRSLWWILILFVCAVAGYGWTLNSSIAVPLILQFIIAYTATAVFNMNSALIIDLFPGKSASATAVNNLMRCSVGAAGVAVIEMIIADLGPGLAFTCLALVTFICSPLVLLEWVYGMRWRTARAERIRKKKNEEKEKPATQSG
ncbi:florfenicol exporter [Glonium stellatum]|uniref:Florfenicol exporter n=1 Tax=Glonium stellatum TaxID=574774 RepID=A0A8E2JTA0_9PEZI|nr:florfenicol exporter [Glonium stellatum]